MAKADLGTKRACLACGMRFYDFSRSPIICPGCGSEFDPENIIKSRKGRPAAKTEAPSGVDETNDDQTREDENADEMTTGVVTSNDDENIDFDENDDVDVDDDGAGIIQDDISDDDELLPSLDDKDDSQP